MTSNIKKLHVSKFVVNLKYGLRKAFNIPLPERRVQSTNTNLPRNNEYYPKHGYIQHRLQNIAGYRHDNNIDIKKVILERISEAIRDI